MQLASGRLGRARTILFCAALSTALVLACGVLPGPTAEVAPSAAPPAEPGPAAAPTATPVAAATDTPAPAPTAAPPEPGPAPDFEALGQAAADYATASRGDPAALAQALEAWGMAPPKETSLAALSADGNVVAADLTGDGTEELVAVAMNPQPQMIMGEGTLLILATEGEGYSVRYDFAATADVPGPVVLLAVTDVDGDSRPDVAFATESCGAHTCFADVRVLSYDAGAYLNLAEGVVSPYPDWVAIEDTNGDGLKEIAIHGNIIGSVGAGPQRPSTTVYSLVEGRYRLTGVEYDPSNLLYFRVVDANLALEEGRIDDAIALYTQALTDESLETSGVMPTAEEEEAALRSFIRFRLIVAYAMQNDPSTGRELAQARAEEGPFLPAAEVFWNAYSAAQSLEAGCTAVADLAERMPELLDILNSFGYANPTFTPEDLCRGAGKVE